MPVLSKIPSLKGSEWDEELCSSASLAPAGFDGETVTNV